jgi:hypothetical protein
LQPPVRLATHWGESRPGHRLRAVAPEVQKPDIRPQLRELLAWYDDVLERVAAGALVAPGVDERLRQERELAARLLELLDTAEESPQPTE